MVSYAMGIYRFPFSAVSMIALTKLCVWPLRKYSLLQGLLSKGCPISNQRLKLGPVCYAEGFRLGEKIAIVVRCVSS